MAGAGAPDTAEAYQNPHPPIWVAALQPSTYEIAASKGIGVLSFGSSAPSSLEPHVKAYRENVKKAKPVGAFVNDQWASSTLGVCLENDREAKEMGAQSLKNFFGPDRPYVQDRRMCMPSFWTSGAACLTT